MANEGFNPDDFREYEERLSKILELQNRATDGLKGYSTIIKDIKEVSRNLNTIKTQETRLLKEIKNKEKERERLLKKNQNLIQKNGKLVSVEVKELEKEIAARKEGLKFARQKTKVLKDNAEILAESANSGNLLSASFVSIGRGVVGAFKSVKGMSKELLKEMKAVQMTEQSMGILSKQSDAFRMNMYRAAGTTSQLGVSAGDLAKMQGSYSDQVGRSVQLSQQGLIAMSEMTKGTMMGAEGAAEMAASMDSFGVSVVGTKEIVEEMMNTSSKMGVNSVKVTANLKKNMQLANRFHFKDGVNGMVRLAASAAKLHLDMDGIASMADKVFRPEGAIEMASRLQTMGGEFAKLGDPFQLMFKARNDFEGFANDIGAATKEFAKFNKESGEFEISGLGYDRIKEISDITGISAEKLAEMGRETAKIEQIEMNVGAGMDEESTAFISSIAQFNKDTNQWEAFFDGANRNIRELDAQRVKEMVAEKQTLKERAKQAQTFDETWSNLKNTFKTLLFPILNGLSEGLKQPLNDFMEWAQKSGGFTKLFDTAKKIGETVGKAIVWISEFVTNNPFTALSGVVAGMGLFKAAQWVANGVSLGLGFNMVANSGGGGITDMLPNGMSKGTSKIGRLRSASKIGKFAKGVGGAGAGLLAAGFSGYDEWTENSINGVGTRENVGRTATRAGLAGGGAWGGAALGATIGTMVFPGVGTAIGGLIGGIAGGLAGDYVGDKGGDLIFGNAKTPKKYNDVIMRSGQAPIGIDSKDDVLAIKKGGAVDKVMDNTGVGSSYGDVKVSFGNTMKIEGSLNLNSDGTSADISLDDPVLLRDLSNIIQQELSKAINGGRMSPNPA